MATVTRTDDTVNITLSLDEAGKMKFLLNVSKMIWIKARENGAEDDLDIDRMQQDGETVALDVYNQLAAETPDVDWEEHLYYKTGTEAVYSVE